jgi:eukaryotic-like serine/threonine-protein kinase
MTKRWLLGLALALGTVPSRVAFAAGSPADVATAQALFDEARKLMNEGRYSEACPKLDESQRIDPGWGTLINLADCHEHVGRTASAWSEFLQVASGSRYAGQTDRAQAAKARATALEPRLSKLTIGVSDLNLPPGFEIKRDRSVVGPAQWGTPVAVDPGEHVVEASAPGKRPWRRIITVGDEGEKNEVYIPPLEDDAPRAPDKPGLFADGPGVQRATAIALGGVGILALSAGGYFALRAMVYDARSDDDCRPYCGVGGLADRQKALDAGDTATIFAIVGGASLAAGAVVYFTARAPSKQSFTVRPMRAANVGLVVGTTF